MRSSLLASRFRVLAGVVDGLGSSLCIGAGAFSVPFRFTAHELRWGTL